MHLKKEARTVPRKRSGVGLENILSLNQCAICRIHDSRRLVKELYIFVATLRARAFHRFSSYPKPNRSSICCRWYPQQTASAGYRSRRLPRGIRRLDSFTQAMSPNAYRSVRLIFVVLLSTIFPGIPDIMARLIFVE